MNRERIARRMVHLRAGRSRETVAEALQISVSTLSMYETGARIPRDEIKIAIARYYGRTVGDIFFNEKDTNRVDLMA